MYHHRPVHINVKFGADRRSISLGTAVQNWQACFGFANQTSPFCMEIKCRLFHRIISSQTTNLSVADYVLIFLYWRLRSGVASRQSLSDLEITSNFGNGCRLVLYDYISNKINKLHYTTYGICADYHNKLIICISGLRYPSTL